MSHSNPENSQFQSDYANALKVMAEVSEKFIDERTKALGAFVVAEAEAITFKASIGLSPEEIVTEAENATRYSSEVTEVGEDAEPIEIENDILFDGILREHEETQRFLNQAFRGSDADKKLNYKYGSLNSKSAKTTEDYEASNEAPEE